MQDIKADRWGTPPDELSLGEDEVHVWRIRLNVRSAQVPELAPVLTRGERREMKRAEQPKHYLAARHAIRVVLGAYLGCEPSSVKLRDAGPGRLEVARGAGPNVALGVCGRRALLAVSATQQVGVAIEEFPSESEVDARLGHLPPREARQMAFLSPQNRASAVIGHQVEGEARERLVAAGGAADSRVERLKVGGSHVAALAADGWDWSPSFWRYERPGEEADEEDG
jgi:hypothetical protein